MIFHGANFDDAWRHCETLVGERGYRYIHSGDEPLLIAGVATQTLEMLEDELDLQVIIVPIGGGSGAAGACIVANGVNPGVRVIGVSAEAAGAAALTAAYQLRSELKGKKVGLVCSGGNLSLEQLKLALASV